VATVGGDWVVVNASRKACVTGPPSALPNGGPVKIVIQRASPSENQLQPDPNLPRGFKKAKDTGRRVFAPMYSFSVTDFENQPLQFADDVVFALCVNHEPGELEGATLARHNPDNPPDSLDYLEVVTPPPGICNLNCGGPAQSAMWMRDLLGGSLVTPTPAYAVEQTGLGGKGRGTSPFAAVGPLPTP